MPPKKQVQPGSPFAPGLWGHNGNLCTLKRLIVVGPYPTRKFFEHIRQELKPKSVLLVVDEGWSDSEIQGIEEVFFRKHCSFEVRYASSPGLVHAKLYLAEWQEDGKNASRWHLGWGSANASQAGFVVNAEVLSFFPLKDKGGDRKVLAWFDAFEEKEGEVLPVEVRFAGDLVVRLPGFRFHAEPEPESFEGWLQAGRLCHKFDPDQTFGRISVQLENPLPPSSDEALFAGAGLKAELQRKTVRYPYVKFSQHRTQKIPRWKMQYFAESWLGHWTSRECYEALGDRFTAGQEKKRREVLSKIAESRPAQQREWIEKFLDQLRLVETALKRQKREPSHYFRYIRSRRREQIDTGHYAALAEKQLKAHQTRARHSTFQERFITGYVFPTVPPFRGIHAADFSFRDFAVGICETIVQSWARGRVMNKLGQAVRRALKEWDVDFSVLEPEDLYEILSEHWQEIGPDIRDFYEDEET